MSNIVKKRVISDSIFVINDIYLERYVNMWIEYKKSNGYKYFHKTIIKYIESDEGLYMVLGKIFERYLSNIPNFCEVIKSTEKMLECINSLSEEDKILLVKFSGNCIKFINNPSDEVKKTAISTSNYALNYIDTLSEKLQMYAINQGIQYVKFLRNLTINAQIYMVTKYKTGISFIDCPTYEVKLAAVSKWPGAFRYINELHKTEDIAIVAVNEYGLALKYIKNPNVDQIVNAIYTYATAAKYVKHHDLPSKIHYYLELVDKYEQDNRVKYLENYLKHIRKYLFTDEEIKYINENKLLEE